MLKVNFTSFPELETNRLILRWLVLGAYFKEDFYFRRKFADTAVYSGLSKYTQ